MQGDTCWANHPGAAAAGTLALVLGLTAFALHWQQESNARTAQTRFSELAREPVPRLAERMRSYEYALLGARSTALTDEPSTLTRLRFERSRQSHNIEREFPGARTVSIIWRVPAADEPAFVAAKRLDLGPDFRIRQLTPTTGDRYVLTYAAPMTLRPGAIGTNLASEPIRRQALDAAMRSGAATISAPIEFFDATQPGAHDFLLVLPIYRPGAATATEAERVAAAIGWAGAPLQVDQLLRSVGLDDSRLTLSLSEPGDRQAPFFTTPGAAEPAAGGLVQRVDLPVYGRVWTVEMRARPRFLAELGLPDPRARAALGGLLAVLSSGGVWLLAQSTRRVQRLRQEQARSAAIIRSSSDAIVGQTLDGIITDWNAGAERLFGFTAQEVLGQYLPDLLLPPGAEPEHRRLQEAMARSGQAVPAFDTVRLHRDGSPIEVSAAVAPIIGADGRVVGFAKTIRDVRAARRAERETRELNVTLERRVVERTASLESARHELQTIIDALPSTIGYWDRHGLNRFANRAYQHWFGVEPAALRGTHLQSLLGDDRYARNLPHIEAALRGQAQTFERTVPRPDGSGVRHALAHYLPDIVGGRVEGFYAFVNDVTELVEGRQRLAAAQRETEALLRTIQLHAIVSVADCEGRIIDVNDGFLRISGYRRDELLGLDHRLVDSDRHDPAFWAGMWASIGAGRPWRGEICNRAKDGSLYWVDSIIAPFAGADGRIEKFISIHFDITAAKQTEQELRASKAFLDRAGEIAGVGGWELDLRSNALTWSAQTYRIHELPTDQPPDLARALDFYPAEARPAIEAAVARAAAEGLPWDIESPFVTARGRTLWVRSQGQADIEDGRAIRLVGAFQDITERKQAQALLKQANDRFAIAADSADIGVWEWELATDALSWDDRMYRLYGRRRSASAEPYSLWALSVHPADRPRAEAALQAALRGEAAYDTEFRIVWPGGEERHLRANARVIRDPAGKPLRMTGVNIDITEKKRAEAELVATASLLNTVLKSALEVSIIAVDPQLSVTVFNAGAQRMLGYRPEEIVGLTTPLLVHDAAEVEQRAVALSAALGRPVTGIEVHTDPSTLGTPQEWTYVRKDGSRLQVSLVVTAMTAADGSCLGFLGVAHDVTARKEQEAAMRKALHRAEDANIAKTRFLANMSHELRTPMNAVIGLTYLLAQSALDPEQTGLIDKLHLAAKSLLRVIDDVLDLSKIESGELTFERLPFGLHQVLQELEGLMSVQAEAKGIEFSVDLPPGVPNALIGDATRLGQVLTNLIANAIKFTDRGAVALGVRLLPSDVDTTRLRFEVTDTGIGIAPEVQPRLFSPFVQADASTKRRFGGTGLGLSIVKRIVTELGGTVGLVSMPGRGSTFWFELPFGQADDGELSPPVALDWDQAHPLHGIRVLVADDSEINLEVARRILEHEGAEITLARNGQEAVDLLRTDPEAFDVVLMDVQMPVLDGHEATRCIRRELGLHRLPIIALTAGALTSEHHRAGAAGMDGFITKPFDVQSLVRTLLRHARPLAAVPADRRAPVVPWFEAAADDRVHWPEIEGIDTADVRGRLGDDLALFRSMLKRLLAEFGDLASSPHLAAADVDNRAWAARLHKLRGSAGMLGARAIADLAAQGEAAARRGDATHLHHCLQQLALKIARLDTGSQAAIASSPDADEEAGPAPATEVDRERLRELMMLLGKRSMNAIDCFETLAPQLRQRLGKHDYRQVHDCIEQLQFGRAAELLGVV